MNYYIFTFGCQMNVSDSQWLNRSLQARGFVPCLKEEDADVFLINTCSVREKPEQKIYSLLGRLQDYTKHKPRLFAAVGGCVAQQAGRGFFQRFPFVRLVFGTDGLVMVPEAIERLIHEQHLRTTLLDFQDFYPRREDHWSEEVPVRAFVNIMQGCNNYCAYCIVPYTRGRQKSRPSQDILDECSKLVSLGTREIVLLGQNVNSYGQDQNGREITFDRLLYLVGELPGLERLRFTTSHPKDIGFQVIKAFSEIPALCPHLHLPLQSGSNRVLKDMGRRYTREKYLEIVESLRAVCQDLALTTDLIVGFPGETEDDFALTLEMLDLVGFDSAFSFKYSDRPGVRAAEMHPKVPEEIKAARLEELQQLQSKWTRIKLAQRVGRTESVLMEDTSKKKGPEGTESWSGRDPGGRVVHLPLPPGQDYARQLLRVKIVRAHKHSLTGEVIKC